jgi:branched-chain amino acid transport system permease protein
MKIEKMKFVIKSSRTLFGLCFIILLVVIVVLAPQFLNNYILNMLTQVFIIAALNQSFNILSGFTGPMSLGHAAFFGVGAYTSTLLLVNFHITPWVGLIIGGLFAALVGLGVGYLAFRYGIQGSYFVLLTIALADSFKIIDSNADFTGGASGLLLPAMKESSWIAFQFKTITPYYFIAFAFMVIITLIVAWGSRTSLGLYLTSIRENEEAASAIGVNIMKYKLVAIASSAFFTAICGTFQAQYIRYIDPPTMFGFDMSIQAMLSAVMGGMGTVLGPIMGSIILTPLSQVVEQLIGAYSGLQTIIYGALLVIIMLVAPKGFWPILKKRIFMPIINKIIPMEVEVEAADQKTLDKYLTSLEEE